MGVKPFGFNHRGAGDAEADLIGHSVAMLLGASSRRPSRCRKQKNRAVGHDSIDIENYQFDLLGAFVGHGVILPAECGAQVRRRLFVGFGACYNFSYN
jgi:hypothetical protein